jgi:hypothetical protein
LCRFAVSVAIVGVGILQGSSLQMYMFFIVGSCESSFMIGFPMSPLIAQEVLLWVSQHIHLLLLRDRSWGRNAIVRTTTTRTATTTTTITTTTVTAATTTATTTTRTFLFLSCSCLPFVYICC